MLSALLLLGEFGVVWSIAWMVDYLAWAGMSFKVCCGESVVAARRW